MKFATRSDGYNPDFDIDLAFAHTEEAALVELFNAVSDGHQTVELKSDKKSLETWNIYVEFEQTPHGKVPRPSGIRTSKADWWVFNLGECRVVCKRESLEWAAKTYKTQMPASVVNGGLNGDCPTRGVLIPLDQLVYLLNQGPF